MAISNDLSWVCIVPGKVKQRVRKALLARHGVKNLQYRVFAAMIYLTLQGRLETIEQIVIDKDYHGSQAEATIKNLLLAHIRQESPGAEAGLIRFANVKAARRICWQGASTAGRRGRIEWCAMVIFNSR